MREYVDITARTLDEFARNICVELKRTKLVKLSASDFSKFIPMHDGGAEFEGTELYILEELLTEYSLETVPRIRGRLTSLELDAPLIIFSAHGNFDPKAKNYRYGLLLVQVAVIFARIDGHIAPSEVSQIERNIAGLLFLSERETVELTAQANYFLEVSGSAGGSQQQRDYVRLSLSRDFALSRMSSLSDAAKSTLIEVAMSVITSDLISRECEIQFLQDIYREFDKNARSVRLDLENYTKQHHISMKNENLKNTVEIGVLEDIEDLLSGLLSDVDKSYSYAD